MARTNLDFTTGLSDTEIATRKSNDRSVWIDALKDLKAGVAAGKGQYDTFYKIGEFGNASGARTAARNIEGRGESLPGVFDLRTVIVNVTDDDGLPVTVTGEDGKVTNKRSSELWAAVVDAEPADGDGGDGNGEVGDGEGDEPTAETEPKAKGRKAATPAAA